MRDALDNFKRPACSRGKRKRGEGKKDRLSIFCKMKQERKRGEGRSSAGGAEWP